MRLKSTLRNKSVGESTFPSGLAISEEWNGLLSNVTGQCQCHGLWTVDSRAKSPQGKWLTIRGHLGSVSLSDWINRSSKRRRSHKIQDFVGQPRILFLYSTF